MKQRLVDSKYFTGLVLGTFLALFSSVLHAHTVRPAVVTVNVSATGEATVRIRLSAEQILAGIGPEYSDTNDAPNADYYDSLRALDPDLLAQQFDKFSPEFLSVLALQADGIPVGLEYSAIDIPPVGDLELARDSEVTLRGTLPEATQALQWIWPRQYGSHVLRYVGSDPADIVSVWLQPGEQAPAYQLGTDGEGGVNNRRGRLAVIADYIDIGFRHIVPLGVDHILFVLGLFLLSLRLSSLLWQVTAFTVAHTLTLGLTMYGVVALPAGIVEPLIALSIVYVGIENCVTSKLHSWRVLLVFAFGLLHGMGFAGVLGEIGLPESEFLTALISFNVGVELGQLAVIAGAMALVGWWRHRSWYRKVVVVPLSLLISATGMYWVWERVAG